MADYKSCFEREYQSIAKEGVSEYVTGFQPDWRR
ncbi:MAG: hypothetical protein K0Q87_5026 [Neobacillus sp.]|jgi:hypothetical protein|nr:hypothetical protein [Neobacillus sp.]